MITKEQIVEIIAEKIKEDDCFIVEAKVSTGNKIMVTVDSMDGLNIDYCIQISRLMCSIKLAKRRKID